MIVFFDTSVHVPLLRGTVSPDRVLRDVGMLPVRLSPVVASELLRSTSRRGRRAVEALVGRLVPIEPPSWRRCWLDVGRLLPSIFPQHEDLGLARLQNDCLLALTARHTGAVLVAADRQFETIRAHVPFGLTMLTLET